MIEIIDGGYAVKMQGLTKREWFAGMALQGYAANTQIVMADVDLAKAVFSISDAMVAHEEKEENEGRGARW
jgi:hypothetical protein